jgi:class 3 adenylate cyclase
MEPIEEWLQTLGLPQYGPAFIAADIDPSVLPDLTEADLERLGVTLGHRKRLLRAIAALAEAVPTAPPAPAAAAAREAERRQVTVMFCDLVGSTALSARLDPEDLRDVIGRYHAGVAETVSRFDGFVAKYMGDGVLVYFGYPQAHEDDAEQAVRAGLALVNAVGELKEPAPLQLRIGIATGLVVVGDLIGAGSAQEQAIVGETPNLAARLQALAEPDAIVIAGSTRRQIGARFELADLGPQSLKGFAEPQRLARFVGEPDARPVRGAALGCDAIGRPRGGDRAAAAALDQGETRRGSGGVARRRGRDRQIAAHRGADRARCRRAA